MTPWMNEGFFADVVVLVEAEDWPEIVSARHACFKMTPGENPAK
jgi:hypothetical protein